MTGSDSADTCMQAALPTPGVAITSHPGVCEPSEPEQVEYEPGREELASVSASADSSMEAPFANPDGAIAVTEAYDTMSKVDLRRAAKRLSVKQSGQRVEQLREACKCAAAASSPPVPDSAGGGAEAADAPASERNVSLFPALDRKR